MHTLASLQLIIEKTINGESFGGQPLSLYQPVAYTMHQGGKRLRPSLMLLACDMFGGDVMKAVCPAVGIEVFHNFTLVHDDIMDQSPIRRGVETVYKKWNPNVAILSGDTMFALAYEQFLRYESHDLRDILKLFTRTAVEVCEGQQLDMDFEVREDVSIDDYLEMIRLKTAVLIAASLAIGARIGGAGERQIDSLYNFGINIGLAFQLMDDLLDVYSDQESFGKVTGNDIVTNKKTFLYLKAYEKADPESKALLDNCFKTKLYADRRKVELVKAIYNKLNIQEETRNTVKFYYSTAMELLEELSLPDEKIQELKALADKLSVRSF